MTSTEKVKQAITHFVEGGDLSDLEILNKVLHPDFCVASYGFMGTSGVTLIDKHQYLANIRDGIFGGMARKMTIEIMDVSENIAMVKLRLESSENDFVFYNSLVLDIDNEWKLIHNLAVVKSKKDLST
ncbi:MAG: nuclear transport factor 2 family protein [Saprospiraceae bacterium]|nr:nuclear transport factor 2 family protein [Saprospiraceae bacterium]MBK7812591.1 nuclear transport factor 2 family protein [Saprospiraceae bacterium]MBK9630782.1 nuclear transport factor 2 family protein [Saprospiraceae bacterium]